MSKPNFLFLFFWKGEIEVKKYNSKKRVLAKDNNDVIPSKKSNDSKVKLI